MKLTSVLAPSFYNLIDPVLDNTHYEFMLTGGRGSCKSSFCSTIIPWGMMEDYHIRSQYSNAVVLRKVGNTLRGSVYSSIKKALDWLGVLHLWKCIVSPMEMVYLPSGQKIIFSGCDDPLKVKSIATEKGWIKYRWYEEFDQFDGMEEIRNLNQSLARGGVNVGLYSFNPPPQQDHWANIENLECPDFRIKHHSTYLDVPRIWLGENFISDANYLKKKNFKAYQNEYLGLVTGVGGEIFKNVRNVSYTDDDILLFERIRQGLDFGFTIDPTAFVKLCYQKNKKKISIYDQLFEYGIGTRELSVQLHRKCNIDEIIKADSQEQRSINTMKTEFNVNITACKKGPDSVRHGIKWLQDLDVIEIDRKRCPDPYREFSCYQYAKNKEGKWIKEYPDENNHCIDATRYSLDDIILQSGWRIPGKGRP